MNMVEHKQNDNVRVVEVYRPTDSLAFFIIGEKIIVHSGMQTFILKYDHANYKPRLIRLKSIVREDGIKSIIELIDYCGFKAGAYQAKSQMEGLELVPTRIERHL